MQITECVREIILTFLSLVLGEFYGIQASMTLFYQYKKQQNNFTQLQLVFIIFLIHIKKLYDQFQHCFQVSLEIFIICLNHNCLLFTTLIILQYQFIIYTHSCLLQAQQLSQPAYSSTYSHMTHLAIKNLAVCIVYGAISILQTLNSRYLYRDIGFDFYSFIFGVQRIFIIALFYLFTKHRVKSNMFVKILPYSFLMCVINILSSYCITIMPLAAFLAFKKFTVVFILMLSLILHLPNKTNYFQNICILGIVIGGCMVGEKDMLHGNIIGYLSCLLFNLSQSMSLQYSNYLYRRERLEPEQLLLYNCVIGLPYYIGVIAYESQFDDIFYFFQDKFSFLFLGCLFFSLILACLSQLSSSYIAMKISPFEKSMVSNVKDLILMVISVQYFADLSITIISGIGMILCMASSILFSLPYLQQKEQQKQTKQMSINAQQQHSDLLDEHSSLKFMVSKQQNSKQSKEKEQNKEKKLPQSEQDIIIILDQTINEEKP